MSSHSLYTPLAVSISFPSYAEVDPITTYPGFTGRVARFQAAKQTLDMQVREQACPTHHFSFLIRTEILRPNSESHPVFCTQWGKDTVYQEDYPALLMATEIGERITYSPSSYTSLLPKFEQYALSAVDEVKLTPWAHHYLLCHLYTADGPEQSQQHCKGATCGSNFFNLTSKTLYMNTNNVDYNLCILHDSI